MQLWMSGRDAHVCEGELDSVSSSLSNNARVDEDGSEHDLYLRQWCKSEIQPVTAGGAKNTNSLIMLLNCNS